MADCLVVRIRKAQKAISELTKDHDSTKQKVVGIVLVQDSDRQMTEECISELAEIINVQDELINAQDEALLEIGELLSNLITGGEE